jgi:pilus assembly protein CpaB
MNRNRLLLIGFVALALGAFVSLVVYRNLQSRAGSKAPPGEDVVVAADDLQVGTKLEDKDIRVVHFPSENLPVGTFHTKTKVVGRGVILPIARGEFVLPNKLAGENAGSGLPSLIPPGMRAVSVRVNDTTSVSGFVQPGTRVDVLLTGNPQGSNEQQTTTVLENVAVIATGTRLERNSAGEAQSAPVITLLVSPDDAERLTLASSQGHIQLALRNPLDTQQTDVAAVKSNSLYKGGSEPAPAAATPRSRPKHIEVQAPSIPTAYTVEVYKGDKKEETKF